MTKHDKLLGGAGGGGGGGGSSHSPTVKPDNLFSDDVVEFALGLCEGPIGGLINGPKSFFLDDTPLISRSGERNFEPFQVSLYHGDADPSEIDLRLGGISSNYPLGNLTLEANVPVTRQTESTLRGQIDRLEIRIRINQLFKTESDGDQVGNDVAFRIQYKRISDTGWKNLYPKDDGVIRIKGKTSSGYAKEFSLRVPRIEEDWEIRVTKLTDDSDDPKKASEISWESFQAITTEPQKYPNLAVVTGLGRASEQFQSIPQFSGVYATKVIRVPSNYDVVTRHYDGIWDGTFKFAVSDNPVWALYDVLVNDLYGFKRYLPNLKVDRFSFYEAARWCDELVPRPAGGFQPRWTFNHKITDVRNARELLMYMAGVIGAVPVTDFNGTVRLKLDRPGNVVQMFGPESITDAGFQYQQTDITKRSNDISVRFRNPHLDWEQDQRRVFDQDLIDENGRIEERLVAVGCNDAYEAQRRGYRRLIQANTETTLVTFTAARSAIRLEGLDMIGIVDPHMNWGLSGRIKSVKDNQIYLRDALTLPVGEDLNFSVQTPSGVHELTVIASQPRAKTLIITEGELPTDLPEIAQFGLTSDGVGLMKPFRVVSIEEDTENDDLLTITALEYNVNKHTDIDNLQSSGTPEYASTPAGRPPAPVITALESGGSTIRTTQDGNRIARLRVSWENSRQSLIQHSLVFIRDMATQEVTRQQVTGTVYNHEDVVVGREYEVWVVAMGVFNRGSVPSRAETHVVAGLQNQPELPEGAWIGLPGIASISISGPEYQEVDFDHYRVTRYDEAGYVLGYEKFSGTTYTRDVPENDDTAYYRVAMVNRSGLTSAPSDPIFVQPRPVRNRDLDPPLIEEIDTAREIAEGARDSLAALKEGYTGELETFADIDAALGNVSSSVTQQGEAIASLEGIASATYTARVSAEGASAGFEMVAASNPQGNASEIRFDADNIVMRGSVQLDHLTVGSGINLLRNADFRQGLAHWAMNVSGDVASATSISLREAGIGWAGFSYPTLQLATAGSPTGGHAEIRSARELSDQMGNTERFMDIPVSPGEWLMASSYVSMRGCTGGIKVGFRDATGVSLGANGAVTTIPDVAGDRDNPDLWPRYSVKVQVPAGAAFAYLIVEKGEGTDSYLIMHKPMIEHCTENTVGPSPWANGGTTEINGASITTGTVTTRHLDAGSITADKTNFGTLDALKLSARTQDIVRNAVSEWATASRTDNKRFGGGWSPYITVTVDPEGDGYDAYIWAQGDGHGANMQVFVNGVKNSAFGVGMNDSGGGTHDSSTLVGLFPGLSGPSTIELMGAGIDDDRVIYKASMVIQMVKR